MQHNIIKLNTRSIRFSSRKYKRREKNSNENKMKEKNITSANINSRRVLKSKLYWINCFERNSHICIYIYILHSTKILKKK